MVESGERELSRKERKERKGISNLKLRELCELEREISSADFIRDPDAPSVSSQFINRTKGICAAGTAASRIQPFLSGASQF